MTEINNTKTLCTKCAAIPARGAHRASWLILYNSFPYTSGFSIHVVSWKLFSNIRLPVYVRNYLKRWVCVCKCTQTNKNALMNCSRQKQTDRLMCSLKRRINRLNLVAQMLKTDWYVFRQLDQWTRGYESRVGRRVCAMDGDVCLHELLLLHIF